MRTVERRKRVISFVTVTKQLVTVEEVYCSFGRIVKSHRLALGMTQEQLADAVGLVRASVANIEIGRQRVLLGDLFIFARALGIEPNQIFRMLQD